VLFSRFWCRQAHAEVGQAAAGAEVVRTSPTFLLLLVLFCFFFSSFPDKFMQKWGKRLLEREREAIAARVNEVSQGIQDVYFRSPKSDA